MPAETPITYGLVIAAIAIVVATWRFVSWLNKRWQETEDKILKQIGEFRTDIQSALSAHRQEIKQQGDDLTAFKLHCADKYLSKDSAAAAFDRFDAGIKSLRDSLEARLIRMEDHWHSRDDGPRRRGGQQ